MSEPTRRGLLKSALAGTAAVGLGRLTEVATADSPTVLPTRPSRSAPNVLMIVVDQLRFDILASYGGRICRTPGLDALASRSVIFDRAYTPVPVCSPARASLLTGVYPHVHEVISNEYPLGNGTIKDSPSLLSRRLEALGYQSWFIGKWHLGEGENLPRKIGLPGHQFSGFGNGGYEYPEYREYLRRKGLAFEFADGPHQFGRHLYATLAGPEETETSAFLAEDAVAFLDRWNASRSAPFFLWVNFWGPHEPYYPTQNYLDLYRNVQIPPWPSFVNTDPLKPKVHQLRIPPESRGRGWDYWEPAVHHYFAFISLIDHQISRILERLRQLRLEENTIVIFIADHGESLGDHGGIQNKGFSMYEEMLRVPMMIQAPGVAARREPALVSLIDLCPTILAAAGETDPEAGRQGRSLLPLLHDAQVPWRSEVIAEYHGMGQPYCQRMLVNKRYKYVWNLSDTDELYDLQQDPHELHNRIVDKEMSEQRGEMQAAMLAWLKQSNDNVRLFQWHMDQPGPEDPRPELKTAIHRQTK